jgi:hypothetical protein
MTSDVGPKLATTRECWIAWAALGFWATLLRMNAEEIT